MFFKVYGFKQIWGTFCIDFENYLVKILRIKLFQKDFEKMEVKLPVKS